MALFADSYMTRVPIKFARSFIYLSICVSSIRKAKNVERRGQKFEQNGLFQQTPPCRSKFCTNC